MDYIQSYSWASNDGLNQQSLAIIFNHLQPLQSSRTSNDPLTENLLRVSLGLRVVSLCFIDITPRKKNSRSQKSRPSKPLFFSSWNRNLHQSFGNVHWHSQVPSVPCADPCMLYIVKKRKPTHCQHTLVFSWKNACFDFLSHGNQPGVLVTTGPQDQVLELCVILVRAITVSGFNRLSIHTLQASITVSLLVFCKFNKNLTKGSIFQWTALGFVCPHWEPAMERYIN